MKAGGIDDRHHVKHTEKLETVVQFDYMFITGGKEPAKDPDQKVEKEYDALTVLVGVDRTSGAIFSMPCPRKGPAPFVVKAVVEFLGRLKQNT